VPPQHPLYLFPLPQGQGELRAGVYASVLLRRSLHQIRYENSCRRYSHGHRHVREAHFPSSFERNRATFAARLNLPPPAAVFTQRSIAFFIAPLPVGSPAPLVIQNWPKGGCGWHRPTSSGSLLRPNIHDEISSATIGQRNSTRACNGIAEPQSGI